MRSASSWLVGRIHVPLGDRLDPRFRQRGKVDDLGGGNSSENIGMMLFEMLRESFHRAALSGPASDQDDLRRRGESRGDFLVEGCLLGHVISAIVSFLAVNQMVMEVVGIVGFYVDLLLGPAAAQVVEDMRCVMVDDDNHPGRSRNFVGRRLGSGSFEKPPEARHFVYGALRRMRLLENFALRAHDECEFLPTVRLYLPQVSHEFDDVGPM